MCPITATLTPDSTNISLSGDLSTITIDESLLASLADFGTYLFVLTVDSANFAGTVTPQAYNFNVIVTCVVTNIAFSSSPPASTTVQVGIDAQPFTIPFATS